MLHPKQFSKYKPFSEDIAYPKTAMGSALFYVLLCTPAHNQNIDWHAHSSNKTKDWALVQNAALIGAEVNLG